MGQGGVLAHDCTHGAVRNISWSNGRAVLRHACDAATALHVMTMLGLQRAWAALTMHLRSQRAVRLLLLSLRDLSKPCANAPSQQSTEAAHHATSRKCSHSLGKPIECHGTCL